MRTVLAGFVFALALPFAALAQHPAPSPTPSPSGFRVTVEVVETAPLPGVDLPIEKVPAPVQTATERDIERSRALDLSDFLNRRVNGVHVNEVQGNLFQADVNYRGYTASPLLGTPQGLSVYMDGVRLNQPFGELVSWDLIPRLAVATTTLMPGSNPMFGLNTLGGALSIQTKDGLNARGTTVQGVLGSDARRAVELEHGGRAAGGLHWYAAANLFGEDGWRDDSPSDVRQLFGKLGFERQKHAVALAAAYADNALNGNGLQEQGFLERDYASVYTKPDTTENRSTFVNLTTRHALGARASVTANAYYRKIDSNTLNGDIDEDALDEAAPTQNGLINRTRTGQHNAGGTGQLTRRDSFGRGSNQVSLGGAYDQSQVGFAQTTELGSLNPDRSVTGSGAFGDQPVDLDGRVRTWSLFATDTLSIREAWHLTLSGRYNRTTIENRDRIEPGGGPGSLDGDHIFGRLNPALGVTFTRSERLTAYLGYSEGSRAATSIELGCADPDQPCKLPNAMAGDPPLDQVVTRTWEAGVRGRHRGVTWNAGVFRAGNRDDILFVTSEQTGFGYFKNFGETRRRGVELGASATRGRVTIGAGYTYLEATFQSEETVNGGSNSSNDAAADGARGLEGTIEIEPGHRIPLIPAHMLKAYAEVQVTSALSVGLDLVAVSSSFARGNENNRHEPDGTYYLGPGQAPGYAVLNLGAAYRIKPWVQVLAQASNLLDRRYSTAAQLGPLGFTDSGAFAARPFPPVNGEYPVSQSTFLAPGAPLRAWIGTRFQF